MFPFFNPPSTVPKARIHHPLRPRRTTHDFLAYGEELTDPDFTTNRMKFTGHERDPETNLDYMLARYYASVPGTFLQPDPGYDYDPMDPMSWNLYGYVRGNPVMGIDPTGKTTTGELIQEKANQAATAGNSLSMTGYCVLKGLWDAFGYEELSQQVENVVEGRADSQGLVLESGKAAADILPGKAGTILLLVTSGIQWTSSSPVALENGKSVTIEPNGKGVSFRDKKSGRYTKMGMGSKSTWKTGTRDLSGDIFTENMSREIREKLSKSATVDNGAEAIMITTSELIKKAKKSSLWSKVKDVLSGALKKIR